MSAPDPLEPQSAALVASLPLRLGNPTADVLRQGHAAMTATLAQPGPEMLLIEDLQFAGAVANGTDGTDGAERTDAGMATDGAAVPALAVRRYVPRDGARRAILYLHGGGWVTGTLDTYDGLCRSLAKACDAQVFSVAYRLSPEARYPAAIEDAVQAFLELQHRAEAFGVDPDRIALAGDSAGGHLAVTAARWLKPDRRADRRAARPAALALIYPVADRRLTNGSVSTFGQGHYLTRDTMEWYWQQFIGDQSIPDDHPDLSPALADDLNGLPPAYIVTAGCDILRDEGEWLAQRLVDAGCQVVCERVPGVIHGFIRFDARLDAAPKAISLLAVGLTKLGF